MSWLKEFILWASEQESWPGCAGTCCKNKWEAAIIIHSFKKHNIKIDVNLIRVNENANWAESPILSDIEANYRNLVFDDLLDEIRSLPKNYLIRDFTNKKSGILKGIMRLFFFHERIKQLELGLLYSPIESFYISHKNEINSG